MFRSLRMELEADGLDYKKSSNLQGVLFDLISPEYAQEMHVQQRHPYSQCLIKEQGKAVWYVNTLDDRAAEEFLQPLMDKGFLEFEIKKQLQIVKIKSKGYRELDQKDLVNEFYTDKPGHCFQVSLLTPTAFKQRGKFVIYPDIRLIYQSLMSKMNAVLEKTDMMDEDTLELMVQESRISRYSLRSTAFPMEGISIPAFMGNFTIKVTGTDTMAGFVRMLLRFGEYAGVGIKAAVGMGAVRCKEEGRSYA